MEGELNYGTVEKRNNSPVCFLIHVETHLTFEIFSKTSKMLDEYPTKTFQKMCSMNDV